VTLPDALILAGIRFFTGVATAEAKEFPIGSHTQDGDKSQCLGAGGNFFITTTHKSCLTKSGDTVVCGGDTDKQKQTCSVGKAAGVHGARLGVKSNRVLNSTVQSVQKVMSASA
jgi:hypothetical protein